MSIDPLKARIEGVYEQRTPGTFMQRVKIPGGVISAEQAVKVADIADRFAGGRLHLTTRGSIEFHDVAGDDLALVGRIQSSKDVDQGGFPTTALARDRQKLSFRYSQMEVIESHDRRISQSINLRHIG